MKPISDIVNKLVVQAALAPESQADQIQNINTLLDCKLIPQDEAEKLLRLVSHG